MTAIVFLSQSVKAYWQAKHIDDDLSQLFHLNYMLVIGYKTCCIVACG